MKVLVIGANGKVGKHIINKLNDSEHKPYAMVRDTDQIPQFEELGVATVLGDLEKDFEHAFHGKDAVIFAAGSGPHTGADKTIVIDQEGAIKAADFAKANGVKRYMMLSSIGADRPEQAPDDFKYYLYAKHRADEYVKSTELDYTIVRPGGLTNEKGIGKVDLQKRTEHGEIPREDVAATLVHLLSVNESVHESYDLISGEKPLNKLFSD
ncbi:SDR family oxidoreductase [Halobacillus litoralis]|uniref:NAD-dependent dehydratase n=1 Tax=Halobacillus litoralis TaxID=45668 RepID=A0A410MCQ8_9BACI|nr:SDR family oxidoreductase [Halobacillus litoralis]QAS52458.1 NAD-dependent dehydratase [Halobacillus litoralis]